MSMDVDDGGIGRHSGGGFVQLSPKLKTGDQSKVRSRAENDVRRNDVVFKFSRDFRIAIIFRLGMLYHLLTRNTGSLFTPRPILSRSPAPHFLSLPLARHPRACSFQTTSSS